MISAVLDTEVKGQLLVGNYSEIEASIITDCFNPLVLYIPFLAPLAHGKGSHPLRGFRDRWAGGWAKGGASWTPENMFMILLVYPLKFFDWGQQKQILSNEKKELEEE